MGKLKEFLSDIADVVKANPKGRRYDAQGRYYPDPTPIAPPIGYKKERSIMDQVRDLVRNEKLQNDLAAAGAETFEEADDFEIGDDYDPRSPFELLYDPDGKTPPWSAFVEEVNRPTSATPQKPGVEEGGAGGATQQPPPPAPAASQDPPKSGT